MNLIKKAYFQRRLLGWFKTNARNFPWRYQNNPYKVFVSEILLQQTNADKVVDPYSQLINQYPDVISLSFGAVEDLKLVFMGLGLFFRAERILRIANEIVDNHFGVFPSNFDDLKAIKGIGDYSASAILCFGYGKRFSIVDTNVIRIFNRVFSLTSEKKRPRTDKKFWNFAHNLLPRKKYLDFNYALLDFAALICRYSKPKCNICPIRLVCSFFAEGNYDFS